MIRNVAAWPGGRRAKWFVLAFWIVLLIPAFMLAGKLGDVQKNDASAWLPKAAESTKVLEQSKKFQPSDNIPALVIYDRPAGITPADMAKATADKTAFTAVPDVTGELIGPIRSKDGKAIEFIVSIKLGKDGWGGISKTVDAITAIADKNAGGLGVHVTGPGGYAADSGKIFSNGGTSLGAITALVVIVILLFTYRSPLLWLLPLISAGVSLFASEGLIYLLAKHAGLTVNAQSSFILTVLVFGAGTDYALLLIARYREELRRHEDRHEAMAEALHRSGPAIIASAATVAISLLCLLLAALNSTKGLGPVCAVGVGVGLLAMITLLPALLVIFGRWIFWPVRPAHGSPEPTEGGLWARVGKRISVRPRLVWIGTAVVLGALALGMTGLQADGIAQKDGFVGKSQAADGEDIMAAHFPAGSGQPLDIVAKAGSAEQVKAALTRVPGVTEVTAPVVKDGEAFLQATLAYGSDSAAAQKTVKAARTAVHEIDGAEAKVGGSSALNLDISDASRHDVQLIIPVVLSFGATLGVSAVVFNHVFGFAGADTSFPLWAFVFLVALGIDYNIFLVTRVREEALEYGTRRGSLIGLSATGGVITSAGLVLAGTFAALGSMPLVFTAELGFAVAFGVLLDTIIVRSVLVTAITLDLGRWMWWPSKLARRQDDARPAEDDLEPVLAGR